MELKHFNNRSRRSACSVSPPGVCEDNLGDLIRGVAKGEQLALSELFEATRRSIFGIVVRILGDEFAAEEVLLDVYCQVWRQAASYDEARGHPIAWLITIARSRAIDRVRLRAQEQLRKQPIEVADKGIAVLPDQEETAAMLERRRMVQTALDMLSPEQREVIELAYFMGMTHSEIAMALGQPLGTVKTRTRRAIIKLRRTLAPFVAVNQLSLH